MKHDLNRRTFIKGTIGAGISLTGVGLLAACSKHDAKGLPTAELGTTGVRIPRIVMGLGSRFCTIESPEESEALLNYALDHGLYYWDTAYIYENKKKKIISEERIGQVTAYRRDEVFLSTKVTSRDPDEAMRQIETSLKRLKTDRLDMLKIHDVQSIEDVNKASAKGNLVDILTKLKEEGVTRFIGFSGHGAAKALVEMQNRADFDSMLVALNHWGGKKEQRQELAVPAASDKGMGVLLMKAVRPREHIKSLAPRDLIRYALSVEHANAVVLGMDSMEVLKANLELLRDFTPMNSGEMNQMAAQLEPFLNPKVMPWTQAGYCDGNWV